MNVLISKKQTFLQGALLLSIAGLLSKILSAMYRVPYQNIVGDVGFYIYQQVYPFYGIALALSLYGFPVVISKMITEVKEDPRGNEHNVLLYSMCTLLVFGFLIFLLLYGFSTKIASAMGDSLLDLPIKLVSFSFLLLPFIAILRGYFQGHENMVPTAISQIFEQFIRVATILFLAYYLVSKGSSFYEVGAGAVFGSVTGGLTAILVLLYFDRKYYTTVNFRASVTHFSIKELRIFPFKKLIISGITICTTGLILVLMQLVDSFTLVNLLLGSGNGVEEAMVVKGVYDRGQPLLQLGVVLATSLSLSLVPAIAKAVVDQNKTLINEKARLAIKISLVVGLGASLGLISIMKYANFMLFTDMRGSNVLSVLSISILFVSLTLTSAAILQGLGLIRITALYVLIGIVVKWLLNEWLIPIHGTFGAAMSTVLAGLVITLLAIATVIIALRDHSFIQLESIFKTTLAGGGMWVIIKGYEYLFFMAIPFNESRFISSIFALSSVVVGGLAFLILIIQLKIFHEKELFGWKVGEKLISKG